jgi:hypothetical protein
LYTVGVYDVCSRSFIDGVASHKKHSKPSSMRNTMWYDKYEVLVNALCIRLAFASSDTSVLAE